MDACEMIERCGQRQNGPAWEEMYLQKREEPEPAQQQRMGEMTAGRMPLE